MNEDVIVPCSPSHRPTTGTEIQPSPRLLRADDRTHKKKAVESSAQLDFTALSRVDRAMFKECDQVRQFSLDPAMQLRRYPRGPTLPSNCIGGQAAQEAGAGEAQPPMAKRSQAGTPSAVSHTPSSSDELKAVTRTASARMDARRLASGSMSPPKKNPWRPQSSRSGGPFSVLSSESPPSQGSWSVKLRGIDRPTANPSWSVKLRGTATSSAAASLGSLRHSASLGSVSSFARSFTHQKRVAVETPPGAANAFEGLGPHVACPAPKRPQIRTRRRKCLATPGC